MTDEHKDLNLSVIEIWTKNKLGQSLVPKTAEENIAEVKAPTEAFVAKQLPILKALQVV